MGSELDNTASAHKGWPNNSPQQSPPRIVIESSSLRRAAVLLSLEPFGGGGFRVGTVPGETSVCELGTALVERLGATAFCWVGPPPGPGIDAVGWRLVTAPRFLFSVSTHAGSYPVGRYDLQVSVIDDTLDNGDIVFLDDVELAELCGVAERFASGG